MYGWCSRRVGCQIGSERMERPELENVVVLEKRLRWSGAFSGETGKEECRTLEAADLRVELSRLRCDERSG